MKKLFGILITSCILAITHTGFAKDSEKLDSIVAVVNDDIVTQSELHRSLTIAKAQISQSHVASPAEATLKKQVLDQLIDKKLQLQVASQVGIKITDTDIDHIVENVASKNNLSVATLYDRIGQGGMSKTEYRRELHDQMTVQKLQQQEVATRITVSPNEIKNFMRSSSWQHNHASSTEYHLEDILIPVADEASTTDIATAKNRAQLIADQLNKGQMYKAIAKDQHDLENNDLGWRSVAEMPSLFAAKVINMQPNEIVGPLQAGNGFHVIRLIATRNAGNNVSTPDAKEIEQFLLQRKFQQNVENWVSKVRGQAFISMK